VFVPMNGLTLRMHVCSMVFAQQA